jgi:hypothetical protein
MRQNRIQGNSTIKDKGECHMTGKGTIDLEYITVMNTHLFIHTAKYIKCLQYSRHCSWFEEYSKDQNKQKYSCSLEFTFYAISNITSSIYSNNGQNKRIK